MSLLIAKNYLSTDAEKVSITLVDLNSKDSICENKKIKLKAYTNLSYIDDEKYDLIIASAIIEHLPAPREDMISLLNMLEKGGVFFARTPFIVPIMKIFNLMGYSIDFTFPGHIHDLGPNFWNNIVDVLPVDGNYQILASRPSPVETSFSKHFFRTLCAHFLKSPWNLFHNYYRFVGGWEIFIQRCHQN